MITAAPFRFAVLVPIAAVLTGCATPAGPLSLSISELGSEVQEDAGSFLSRIKHRRSHNITGLGSADTVGMLSVDPDPPAIFRWPSFFTQATLPDQMAPRIHPQCSKVVVRDLPMGKNKGLPEVLALRDSLQTLQTASFQHVRLATEAALVTEIVSQSEAAAPADAASAPPDARAQRSGQQRDALIRSWHALSTQETPADKSAWQARLDQLQTELAKAQARIDAASAEFGTARQQQGVIVARWEYQASKRSGFEAIGLSQSSRKADSRTGFVVLGHPRTLTLIAGNDLVSRVCRAEDASCREFKEGDLSTPQKALETRSGIDSMIPPRRLYTTTFQLLAEHVAWAESGTVEEQAAFAAQVSEVMKTVSAAGLGSLKAKLQALQINVAASSESRTNAENLGAVSGSHQWDESFTFWNDDAYVRSITYLRALNGSFFPLSSMRTTLDAYATHYGARKPEKEDACETAGPTEDMVKKVVSAQMGCDQLGEPEFMKTMDSSTGASRRGACGRLVDSTLQFHVQAAAHGDSH